MTVRPPPLLVAVKLLRHIAAEHADHQGPRPPQPQGPGDHFDPRPFLQAGGGGPSAGAGGASGGSTYGDEESGGGNPKGGTHISF